MPPFATLRFTSVAVLSILITGVVQGQDSRTVTPPVAERRPITTTLHGDTRTDDYGWLREKDNPEVIAYLEAENAYAEAATAHTEELQQAIYDELLGRITQTDVTAATYRDGWWYYSRTEEEKDYPIRMRRPGTPDEMDKSAPEQVLIDGNAIVDELELEYFRLSGQSLHPDSNSLAFTVDTTGYETVDVWLKDLTTGEIQRNIIEGVAPFSLALDNAGNLYYARFDASKRPNRVFRHRLGSDPATDELVITESDPKFNIGVSRSLSDGLIVITSASTLTSEVWVLDANDSRAQPRSVAGRTPGVRHEVDHRPDGDGMGWLYVKTDAEAPNERVLARRYDASPFDEWEEVVEHDPAVKLDAMILTSSHLVLQQRERGLTRVRQIEHATGQAVTVRTPETVSIILPFARSFNADHIWYRYQSPITPTSVYRLKLGESEGKLVKRDEVPSGHNPQDYTVKREWVASHDGVQVPITIIHRRDIDAEVPHPTLLFGYGSYGFSVEPWYRDEIYPLLDRGFVYVIAHIRGGGELGRVWKDDGRLGHKANSFIDFIAVAEYIIDRGYTSPAHLGIEGWSAGGLLVGAVINSRPDLFRAAFARVPFVDVLNTMLDASIPLTTSEYEEWGNPNIAEEYQWIRAYCPYTNVKAQAYPDLLVTAGLNDPSVHYWEPAKWVAKLRAVKTGDSEIILRTNMGAGHRGESGRYGRYEELAYEIAFFIDRLSSGR